jgi:hypothetical protein
MMNMFRLCDCKTRHTIEDNVPASLTRIADLGVFRWCYLYVRWIADIVLCYGGSYLRVQLVHRMF